MKNLFCNLTPLLLASLLFKANAATITYTDNVNQVVYSNGSEIAYNEFLALKIGWFNDSFTPTASNFSQWENNFNSLNSGTYASGTSGRGFLGYASNPSYASASSIANISAQIVLGQNSGSGATDNLLLPPGKTIWLIGSSVSYNTASTSGLIYSPTAQFFAAQDSRWTSIPTVTDVGGGSTDYALQTIASSAAIVVGSYNSVGSTIVMVPEPSTGALMIIGAAGLVALRRLRKV